MLNPLLFWENCVPALFMCGQVNSLYVKTTCFEKHLYNCDSFKMIFSWTISYKFTKYMYQYFNLPRRSSHGNIVSPHFSGLPTPISGDKNGGGGGPGAVEVCFNILCFFVRREVNNIHIVNTACWPKSKYYIYSLYTMKIYTKTSAFFHKPGGGGARRAGPGRPGPTFGYTK